MLVATPELLLDINTTTGPSNPQYFTTLGSSAYFFANRPDIGYELFKTDGTSGGTSLVKDIRAGTASSYETDTYPAPFSPEPTVVGSILYFVANDGTGRRLWRTDGTTAGTRAVYDTNISQSPRDPSNLTNLNGTLHFFATDPFGLTRFFKTNGTAAGTVPVEDRNDFRFYQWQPQTYVPAQQPNQPPRPLMTAVGNRLYFPAFSPSTGTELWSSDGTSAGTQLVADLEPGGAGSDIARIASLGSVAYFARATQYAMPASYALWHTDGTVANTQAVPNVTVDPLIRFAPFGTRLYFAGFSQTYPGVSVLMATDGTAANTGVVGTSFAYSETPAELTVNGSALYYTAVGHSSGFNGGGLFKVTTPTDAPTLLCSMPTLGYASSHYLTPFGTNLCFVDSDSVWLTDGTQGNLVSLTNAPQYFDPHGLTAIGTSKLVFAATESAVGTELWSSNGTLAGSSRIADINTDTNSSNISDAVRFKGKIFFIATDAATGGELWCSDGTSAGTQRVIDLYAGATGSSAHALTVVGNTLYFSAYTPAAGYEVFATDGTAAGTHVVHDRPAASSAYIEYMTSFAGKLYFLTKGSTNRPQLWSSDGTDTGTVMVNELNLANYSGRDLMVLNGALYFLAYRPDQSATPSLWKADGVGGVTKLGDFSTQMYYLRACAMGGKVYFAAWGQGGEELYVTDGTAAGTRLVVDLFAGGSSSPTDFADYQGQLYFTAFDGSTMGLFRSDGTASGTARIDPSVTASFVANLFVYKEKLFFTHRVFPQQSDEMWVSDGTWAGSQPLLPGGTYSASSAYSHEQANDSLFWIGNNGKLYQSDGTVTGTAAAPGSYVGYYFPRPLAVGNYAFFAAQAPGTGAEPFRILAPDTLSPSVGGTRFDQQGRQAVELRFSEDVTIDPAGISVARVGGATLPASQVKQDYSEVSRTLTLTISGTLVDGNYRVTLTTSAAKDQSAKPLAATYTYDFFILTADANHDRFVNSLDFSALATHFNESAATFSNGDFNSDGRVNGLDFNLLASKFGTVLAPPAPALAINAQPLATSSAHPANLFSSVSLVADESDAQNILDRAS